MRYFIERQAPIIGRKNGKRIELGPDAGDGRLAVGRISATDTCRACSGGDAGNRYAGFRRADADVFFVRRFSRSHLHDDDPDMHRRSWTRRRFRPADERMSIRKGIDECDCDGSAIGARWDGSIPGKRSDGEFDRRLLTLSGNLTQPDGLTFAWQLQQKPDTSTGACNVR